MDTENLKKIRALLDTLIQDEKQPDESAKDEAFEARKKQFISMKKPDRFGHIPLWGSIHIDRVDYWVKAVLEAEERLGIRKISMASLMRVIIEDFMARNNVDQIKAILTNPEYRKFYKMRKS